MKNRRTLLLFLLPFIIGMTPLRAQEKGGGLIDPCLSRKSDEYMNRQQEALLQEIFKVLDENPPSYPPPKIRQTALYLFDAVTHDKYAAFRQPLQETFRRRIDKAIKEIGNTSIAAGARIWKFYNMGFVVRTASVTIAFDIVRGYSSGSKDFALPDDYISQLAKQCDVLFVSHWHKDHRDKTVARIFLEAGKPVVASPQIWQEDPIYTRITHLERVPHKVQRLPVKDGTPDLGVVIYPGHQMEKTLNNVTLVLTPDSINFVHLGDQINEDDFMIDFKWIDRVKNHFRVDFIMPTVWANDLVRITRGFDPVTVLPGHANELGHPVYDRDPFWGDTVFSEPSLKALLRSGYPVIMMLWGESYHYLPAKVQKNDEESPPTDLSR